MNNALFFLINTAFNLYLMVVVLRLWLQLARADFYNPFSQFIVKATNPLVLPMRKVIPSLGQLDTATLVLAWLVAVVKMLLIQQLFLGQIAIPAALVAGLIILLKETLSLVFWIVIIRAILSWFSQGRNPIEQVMHQLTEPLLRPIRRVIPPLGGLDLSVLVVLIGLQFIQILLADVLRGF
ncbi:YggT family protein [Alkalimonas collagenimarina]|uniref:YggT family protein n=1 Tax=Alkalimonas collagenimarina TaxID=400390 RepID=A0ABT9GUA2_9GAMM|nr:YggT family protein [Alkalimonas collagenimarina]MDP4534622.1 YggT family protein [Alkalimonas collagenimarina]